jgi:hypothetical protein
MQFVTVLGKFLFNFFNLVGITIEIMQGKPT